LIDSFPSPLPMHPDSYARPPLPAYASHPAPLTRPCPYPSRLAATHMPYHQPNGAPMPIHSHKEHHCSHDMCVLAKHVSDPSVSRCSVVSVLACALEHLCAIGDQSLPTDRRLLTVFHTSCIPSISITAYLHRLARYTECSQECLIQAVCHIHRVRKGETGNEPFQVNAFNIHRLLLTALLCTSKWFDDHYFNNSFYAKVGGIACSELNMLEVEFLSLINFDLFLPVEQYMTFVQEINQPHSHQACTYKHTLMHTGQEWEASVPSPTLSPLHSPSSPYSSTSSSSSASPSPTPSPSRYHKLSFTRTVSPTSAYCTTPSDKYHATVARVTC